MAASRTVRPILIAGLIAGTLDITYACVFFGIRNHVSPIRIFQSVARGALGQRAFQGGLKVAALGLFFHFLIALTAAAVYFFMYGIVMRFAAIHSTTLPWSYPWVVLIPNLLIHMFGIGLPIALVTRKYSK